MPSKFSLSLVAKKNTRDTDGSDPRKPKVPRVRDLTATPELCPVEPPAEVVAKLGEQNLTVGIDIETADWTEKKHALHKGQFGFHTMCGPEVFDQRIIQIGWFVKDLSNPDADNEHDELIIQPDGFEIAVKATKLHGVSNERAQHDGMPLKTALDIFMRVMERLEQRSARLVIHHLEFDAGIIDRELTTAGLDHYRQRWQSMARAGFCTMDPTIGQWIQHCCGRTFDVHENSTAVMSLERTINLLSPSLPVCEAVQNFRRNRLHTAGSDAQLHCLIYKTLREMATNGLDLAAQSKLARP